MTAYSQALRDVPGDNADPERYLMADEAVI